MNGVIETLSHSWVSDKTGAASEGWHALGGLSNASAPAGGSPAWPIQELSNDGVPVAGVPERLRNISQLTALSWEAIALTIGVSRRSVHLWLSQGNISAENAARVAELERLIQSARFPREAPEDFKLRLTDAGTGDSLLAAWRRRLLAATPQEKSVLSRLDADQAAGLPIDTGSTISPRYEVIDL